MHTDEIKFAAALIIFLFGMGGGWLALRADAKSAPDLFFAAGSVFAAGIFLGAGFIHLLPDAADTFGALFPEIDYPMAFLGAGLGFAVILLFDQLAHARSAAALAAEGHGATPYLVAVALSIHSILAGAAFGAEEHPIGSALIFVAIVGHKGSAGFALAVSMVRGAVARVRAWRVLVLFSLMTPLGILIGILGTWLLNDRDEEIFEAIFDALAAGTFIYIAAIEIVAKEFRADRARALKLALLLAGLGLMAMLAVWL